MEGITTVFNSPSTSIDNGSYAYRAPLSKAVNDTFNNFQNINDCKYLPVGVANAMGLNGLGTYDLTSKTADDMVEYIQNRYPEVVLDKAVQLANEGNLVLATGTGAALHDTNGHIAIIMPGPGDQSVSWARWVPNAAQLSLNGSNFNGSTLNYSFQGSQKAVVKYYWINN